jgi:hypothetical protein
MASPNSSYTEIVTTTVQGYSKQIADNVTNHNALARRIDRRGNKRPATGRVIVQELEFAENSTVKWYSGTEVLNVNASNVLSAAEYSYKQLNGNVVISGLEQIQNSGKEAVHNLLRARIGNLERSLKNTLATAMFADGTGTSSKELGGLKHIVADDPTSTVGGISGSSYSFWQNKEFDASDESVTLSATTMQASMNTLWLRTIRGADKPDFIVGDTNYFKFYWESLQTNQRFTSEDEAAAGFMTVKYMSADVFYDDQCPTNRMYFLNSDYLFLRPSKGREFMPLGEKAAINQDAIVVPVVWAGNMTCSNRALQGVIQP